MTIVDAGWVNPTACYLDFVSQFNSGWLWQLYANRSLIGVTRIPAARRIVGQLVASVLPTPLTLIRVAASDILTDHGQEIPPEPWNQYKLDWTASGSPPDTDHYDVIQATAPGGSISSTNVLARVPFTGDGAYQFVLPAFNQIGAWPSGILPRDNAKPLGNAGAIQQTTINVLTAPPDVRFADDGSRLQLSVSGGVLTAAFAY